ncbi:hypothetical protein EVB91_220 [Rhizobium phage RHph_I1_18]|nr:hypothetical protein EVB91_220 [Rhizobium phage RHph_I1_18]
MAEQKVYETRAGHLAIVVGAGPLSKTFIEVSIKPFRYLVWAKTSHGTLRYRMDEHDHNLDLIEIQPQRERNDQ